MRYILAIVVVALAALLTIGGCSAFANEFPHFTAQEVADGCREQGYKCDRTAAAMASCLNEVSRAVNEGGGPPTGAIIIECERRTGANQDDDETATGAVR